MKISIIQNHFLLLVLLVALLLIGCTPTSESTSEVSQGAPEASQLATAKVSAQLTDQIGRAIITGHKELQFVVDASPSSEGLDEIETLLAAQATCGVFVAEKAALELDVPLTGATATAEFNEDEQNVHVYLDLPGANSEQVLDLANNFRQRCPIYTTLAQAKSVEFSPEEQFEMVTEDPAVVTATIFRFGGANVTAQDNTFVMDSVPPLDGPNEELNPLDLLLGGLAACSSFTYQNEAPQTDVTVIVEADFDPSGVRDLEGPNPRIQDIRISLQVDDYDQTQADKVEKQIKEQCHLYKILSGTVDFEILIKPVTS